MKVAQEVQEAHRRGTTDPSQQPGPAYPSGTRHPFPTALSELVYTWREPRRPRPNSETPLGRRGAGLAWGSLSQGEGMEEREGRAIIPVPHGPDTWELSQSRNPAMWGKSESTRGKEGASPAREWTARDSSRHSELFQRMGGRTRRKQQTHSFYIKFHI